MRRQLVDKMCCPFDKEALNLQIIKETPDANIVEGILTCSHCQRYYPIVHGIPIMSPDEFREKTLEAPILERWGLQLDENQTEMRLKPGKDIYQLKS